MTLTNETEQTTYDDGNGAILTTGPINLTARTDAPKPNPETARNKQAITLGLHIASGLAPRARRLGSDGRACLLTLRRVGRQLDALDPSSPVADAVIAASAYFLQIELDHITDKEARA